MNNYIKNLVNNKMITNRGVIPGTDEGYGHLEVALVSI